MPEISTCFFLSAYLSNIGSIYALKVFIERAFVGFEEDHCSWIEVLYSHLRSHCEFSITVVAAVPVAGYLVSEPVKKGKILDCTPINPFLMTVSICEQICRAAC